MMGVVGTASQSAPTAGHAGRRGGGALHAGKRGAFGQSALPALYAGKRGAFGQSALPALHAGKRGTPGLKDGRCGKMAAARGARVALAAHRALAALSRAASGSGAGTEAVLQERLRRQQAVGRRGKGRPRGLGARGGASGPHRHPCAGRRGTLGAAQPRRRGGGGGAAEAALGGRAAAGPAAGGAAGCRHRHHRHLHLR